MTIGKFTLNEKKTPFLLNFLINLTYGLAILPLLTGMYILFILIISGSYIDYTIKFFEGTLFQQSPIDDLTNIGPFMYLFGNILFFIGIFSLVGNYLLDHLKKTGLSMMIMVYLGGALFSAYMILKNILTGESQLIFFMIYAGFFGLGIIALYILIFYTKTRELFY